MSAMPLAYRTDPRTLEEIRERLFDPMAGPTPYPVLVDIWRTIGWWRRANLTAKGVATVLNLDKILEFRWTWGAVAECMAAIERQPRQMAPKQSPRKSPRTTHKVRREH